MDIESIQLAFIGESTFLFAPSNVDAGCVTGVDVDDEAVLSSENLFVRKTVNTGNKISPPADNTTPSTLPVRVTAWTLQPAVVRLIIDHHNADQ